MKVYEDRHDLVVHIGTPKTGTSSLQMFCYENSGFLRKSGWDYPHISEEWKKLTGQPCGRGVVNGAILLASFENWWMERDRRNLWNLLNKHLQYHNVILSEEVIWDHPAMEAADIIAEFQRRCYCAHLKVIVYLRRQDLYLESLWNQGIKEYLLYDRLCEFIDKNKLYIDYLQKLNDIATVVGKENVIVRVYENGQLKGRGVKDTISDFLNALDIKDTDFILSNRENERLDEDCLEYKRLFNAAYARANGCGNIEVLHKYFCKWNNQFKALCSEEHKCGYLSRRDREEILKKCAGSNEIIAKEYLGREDGKLFYDLNVDIFQYNPQMTDREMKLVELFAGLAAELSLQVNQEIELKLMPTVLSIIKREVKRRTRNIRVLFHIFRVNFK